jgi:hypothetical protein
MQPLLVVILIGGMLLVEAADLDRTPAATAQGNGSLRFFGTGAVDADRVKIPLGPLSNGQLTSSYPVNVGGDFTIEFWMRAATGANSAEACGSGNSGWYYGNVVIDRDVFGEDVGDYGLAIRGGRIIFGVNNGSSEANLCGNIVVTNDNWRHIAVTRSAATGLMRIFIDGQLDATTTGPSGPIAYPVGRTTAWPASDPYLVLAAEKHDYPGSRYYNGLLDDLRISNSVRYSTNFTRPNAPHPADANTVARYRFDEGAGASIGDSSGATGGPSNGQLVPRSSTNSAEHWSGDTPFTDLPISTNTPTTTATSTPPDTPINTPTNTATTTPTVKPTCTNIPTNTTTSINIPPNTHTPTNTSTSTNSPNIITTNTSISNIINTSTSTSTSTPVAAPEPEQSPSSTISAGPPVTDLPYQVYLPLVSCN